MTLQELEALAEEIHKNAIDKGFWDRELSESEIRWLIKSELYEAFECLRNNQIETVVVNGKPEGFWVEIADFAIRCMDFIVYRQESFNRVIWYFDNYKRQDFSGYPILGMCYKLQNWKITEEEDIIDSVLGFALAMLNQYNNLHLIREKHEYNKTREYKHGKEF